MPGRFSHLEFDDNRRRQERQRPPGVEQPSAAQYLQLADDEQHWGRFEPALQFYTKCLEENRRTVPAWVGQVQMLVQLSEYHEARLWADKALEIFRNNGELLAAKAQACLRQGDRKAAYACSDASLQVEGSSPWRWQARGEVLLESGEKLHESCFKKALAEAGADWFDRIIIAQMYLFYRKASAAFEYARKATELRPDAGYTWFVMGNTQRALGLAAAADQSYSRCLELRPDFLEARAAMTDSSADSFIIRVLRRLGWRRS
ncbi:MAG: hypothetical protein WC869_14165 [Phycisphaerae bacterium]|jgi:tetratricopeptide (TPR) repeat protein